MDKQLLEDWIDENEDPKGDFTSLQMLLIIFFLGSLFWVLMFKFFWKCCG
ncbi:hypothetical protein KJ603_02265 [Patescibacteria group bacterium]|nr:hypothetical protein [Patescibacteria group bacterium]